MEVPARFESPGHLALEKLISTPVDFKVMNTASLKNWILDWASQPGAK
jgi:hypothetical protein